MVALALVAVTAATGLLVYRYNQIDRIDLPDQGRGSLEEDKRGEPQNFLIIGSDSRAFVEVDAEREAYGTADALGPPKADTILVARTFPADDRIALISFPRDLWVPISGTSGKERINTAIEGGTERLIATLNDDFGIPIHHVVQIDFRGFKGLVNAVGGVDVYFPSPVRDWDREKNLSPTGLDIREPGCVRLNGDVALAYVRSRHYERLIDGQWQADPTGDLNRITRQQDFIRRTLRQSLSRGLGDPRRLDGVVKSVIDFVELDHGLGWTDILDFGRQFRSLSAESLETYALPTTPGKTAGGADVLFLQEEPAQPVLDVFRGVVDRPTVLLPGSVNLNVVDGSGRRNLLYAAAFRLAASGFTVANTGDGERTDKTTIRYAAGQRAKAELLASALTAAPELVEDVDLAGVDLVLVLGRDFRGVKETSSSTTVPAGDGSTTAPTVPPSTQTERVPATPEC